MFTDKVLVVGARLRDGVKQTSVCAVRTGEAVGTRATSTALCRAVGRLREVERWM
jgi:hypothetical protein